MLCHLGTLDGRDFVPSRKHSQEHFSTDSIVRKTNLHWEGAQDPKSRLPQILHKCSYVDQNLSMERGRPKSRSSKYRRCVCQPAR